MSQSRTSEPPAAWWTPRTTIRPTEEDLPSEARPYKQYCTTVRTSVKAEATLIGSGLRPPGTSSTAGGQLLVHGSAPQTGCWFHQSPASVGGTQEPLFRSEQQAEPSLGPAELCWAQSAGLGHHWSACTSHQSSGSSGGTRRQEPRQLTWISN